jgi:hypothetical protein
MVGTNTMTEHMGRTARWGTLALVAPMAAGAFAVATAWGNAHQPTTSASSTDGADAPAAGTAQAQVAATLDKSLVALQQQALAEQARVTRLQQALERVRTRTRALRRAPLPGVGGPAVGGSSSQSTSSHVGTTAAAPPPVVTAPAPAPATHAKTGAS